MQGRAPVRYETLDQVRRRSSFLLDLLKLPFDVSYTLLHPIAHAPQPLDSTCLLGFFLGGEAAKGVT